MATSKDNKASTKSRGANGKAPAAKPQRRQALESAFAAIKNLIDEPDPSATHRPASKGGKYPPSQPPEVGTQIQVWEDDPFLKAVAGADPVPATPIDVDVPVNDHELLQTEIEAEQPAPGLFDPGTSEFLFWNAAAALARGINFWAPLLPDGTVWSCPRPMAVNLDEGIDLNAFYSRDDGMHFFHDEVAGTVVFSGESPDIVCHELGHAILDALKPELFDTASLEVGAFHESFADTSAMLSALQIGSMREFVLEETGGELNLNSRLSQSARQLGWAIRLKFGADNVDTDCLRNAANSFFYQDPATLPPSAPASQLSSEVHSFARVFTGAFLDVIAGMFEIGPAGTTADDSEKLLAVSQDAGRLLVEGIRIAPVGAGFYSQVAAGIVQADQSLFSGRYRAALVSGFVGRGILAPESAVGLVRDLQANGGRAFGVTGTARARQLQFDGDNEGFKKSGGNAPTMPLRALTTRYGATIHVHMPSEPNRFGVAAAAVGGGSDQTTSAEDDARSFVEDLIQLGRIAQDEAPGVIPAELLVPGNDRPGDKTHRLVKEDEKVVLKRNHFCCGFHGSFGCRLAR